MVNVFFLLLGMALVLFLVAHRRGDGTHRRGLITARTMFRNVLPMLVLAFTIAGLLRTVIPTEFISAWLGDEAGWKGFFIGPAIGMLIQGGPFAFFPFFEAVFKDSVGIGTAIAMITGWGMLNIGFLPFEFAFLGPKFVGLKLLSCVAVPPLSGLIAHLVFG